MMKPIVVKHSILITKPISLVWAFTQDYNNRCSWDKSVKEAILIESSPVRIAKLRMKWNTSMTFYYKQFEAPTKTTLVAKDIKSMIIERAGGSWLYEEKHGGTYWTQINSVTLKNTFILKITSPILKLLFLYHTKNAMNNLKTILEGIEEKLG